MIQLAYNPQALLAYSRLTESIEAERVAEHNRDLSLRLTAPLNPSLVKLYAELGEAKDSRNADKIHQHGMNYSAGANRTILTESAVFSEAAKTFLSMDVSTYEQLSAILSPVFAATAEDIDAMILADSAKPLEEKTSSKSKDQLLPNSNSKANRSLSAVKEAANAQALRVSRRILMAERAKKCSVVCPDTGIVSLLDIPAIPGKISKAMMWTSPYASTSNCRGIAQQEPEFLAGLDTQVLAGVLITLANVYDLLRFRPADSGAQKNAILRTAGKSLLIRVIKTLEDHIHSRNMQYMPRLSLVLDLPELATGVQSQMTEWLKLITEVIYKKEEAEAERTETSHKIRPQYTRDAEKQRKGESWAATQARWAVQREFKADKKLAKTLIATLAKTTEAKPKLITALNGLFGSDDGILVVNKDFLGIIVKALNEKYPCEASNGLITLLTKDRSKLADANDPFADEVEEKAEPVFKTVEQLMNYVPKKSEDALDHTVELTADELIATENYRREAEGSGLETEFNPVDTLIETTEQDSGELISEEIEGIEEGFLRIEASGSEYDVEADYWNSLTFTQKLKYKRALASGEAFSPDFKGV